VCTPRDDARRGSGERRSGAITEAKEFSGPIVLYRDEALPDLFEARAVIEQLKGVLMAIYRVSADQAFGVLRWRSQESNTKLRALAKQLLAEIATLPPPSAEVQSAFDHLLLTVQERILGESNA
jgi:ANTAR domain